jgi:cyclopropane fatty-acyl-phospholipid synthase-like methyltransferase
MSALSAQANAYLLQGVDFNRFTHVVDVGGGDGSNALALARQFPELRVTVFDSPSVCEIAKHNIADAGLQDRVTTCAGDMFSDPFPEGVDAILFSHIFTIWSLDKNLALLKKCYDTLPEGGSALIFGMMGADDDTGPLGTALGSPYFLAIATGEGMLYSWADYEEKMQQAGFATVERVENIPLNHGVIIGTK